ncbi:MAG: type II secretion system F family protein [Dehalococcoidales bacterium]|nr:type II secretion system F family protein [Dehalococcoidales bacterium]
MVYKYLAYNGSGKLVKGTLSAADEEAANEALTFAGFRTVSLKKYVPLFSLDKLGDSFYQVKPTEVILFYRQLAMLIKSGTNIATAVDLLQQQSSNRKMQQVLREVISEIRGGGQLSTALGKNPKIFAQNYTRLLNVGEQSGNPELVMEQIADYMERELVTSKEVKGALMMPGITAGIAVVVVGLLVMFVLPSFGKLYDSLGAKLPPAAKTMMAFSTWSNKNWLSVVMSIIVIALLGYLYVRTPKGRYNLDKLLLNIPLLGRVRLLSELSRLCRSVALLVHAGLPLTETMNQVIQGSTNRVVAEALNQVRVEMMKGEGLSRPMSKNKLFLPMMVQMISVGEETGNLDTTLIAVATSYEAEAADTMHTFVGLIQPTMTIGIGLAIAGIAITLFSTIYGMTEAF